jgi:hypothetical protein
MNSPRRCGHVDSTKMERNQPTNVFELDTVKQLSKRGSGGTLRRPPGIGFTSNMFYFVRPNKNPRQADNKTAKRKKIRAVNSESV